VPRLTAGYPSAVSGLNTGPEDDLPGVPAGAGTPGSRAIAAEPESRHGWWELRVAGLPPRTQMK
jgi:hypothetical protein